MTYTFWVKYSVLAYYLTPIKNDRVGWQDFALPVHQKVHGLSIQQQSPICFSPIQLLCRQMLPFALSDLAKCFIEHPKSVNKLYPCLLETIVRCCLNLQKLAGVRICPERLNLASRKFLEGLPYVTSVALDGYYIEMSILFNFLKHLPNLRSVELQNIWANGKIGDMPEEEKLDVPELRLEFGAFWRVFRVDRLRKLVGLAMSFKDEEEREEFSAAIASCQNLEQLQLKICMNRFDLKDFPQLILAVKDRLKELTLKIECHGLENAYGSMHEFPFVWQHTPSCPICSLSRLVSLNFVAKSWTSAAR